MLDGDDTYKPEELPRLLEPLESGFCDVVLGSRLAGKMTRNSMRTFNRIGNWFFSMSVRAFYRVNATDTLTGYFAWRREALVRLRPHVVSSGFAIEMEIISEAGSPRHADLLRSDNLRPQVRPGTNSGPSGTG